MSGEQAVGGEQAVAPDRDGGSDEAAEGYALIVGAFSDKANATRLVARLRKAGYPAKMVQSSVGLNKVALRTFANEDSARKAKTELRADFPAVWIYRE